MVTTFYPPHNFGGDGQYIRRLSHALARKGCEVTVIHDADAYFTLSGGQNPAPLEEPPGVTVETLRSGAPALSCLATQQLGRPIVNGGKIAAILDRGFDVIHYHNISLVGGPGVLSIGDAVKLYTTHEHWLVCPMHILWRHNREVCTSRACLKCSLIHKRPPQLWRMTDLLDRHVKHVDAFMALSQSCADNHKAFGFKPPMRITPSFLPDEPPIGPREQAAVPYFLFVGRLEIIKGLQDVIPVFDDAAPAELWIVGSGAYENELRRIAGASTKVKFLGRRTPDELRGLYRDSIASIAPSACYEVFPMVVLESFREAAPVIARDLGPFPEILKQSGGGVLFKTREDIRCAVEALASDPAMRTEMGARARAAFDARWSERVALDTYFSIIGEIAEKKGDAALVGRAAAMREPTSLGSV